MHTVLQADQGLRQVFPQFFRGRPSVQSELVTINDPATGPDHFVYWLATVARELRIKKSRKLVHIAAKVDRGQATIYRFEKSNWVRNPDLLINAYAEDLGVNPWDIWLEAVRRFEDYGQWATTRELLDEEAQSSRVPAGGEESGSQDTDEPERTLRKTSRSLPESQRSRRQQRKPR